MESPSSARGRGRFSARKRHTFPARSSSQHLSDASENPSSGTPAVAQSSSSLSFETPSPSNARGSRMRTRNIDGVLASPDEPGSKGGRSLRKRTRIDYSFDQADEEDASIEAKSTPTSTRSLKKRKTDLGLHDEDQDEDTESLGKRRTSEQPTRPTSRRNAARKPTVEPQPFVAEERDEDVPVQDTIEVGGHHSEQASESSSRQRARSGSSRKDATSPTEPVRQNTTQPPTQSGSVSISITDVDGPDEHEVKLEERKDEVVPKMEMLEQPPSIPQQHEVDHNDDQPEPAPVIIPVSNADANDPYAHLTPYVDGAKVYYPAVQTEHEVETEAAEVVPETEDVIDDQHEAADEDTPVGSPGANEDTAVNSPAPDLDIHDVQPLIIKNQYPFKKVTAAEEFIKLFQDIHSLSQEELYSRAKIASKALAAWQNEFDELRKITDDEDNALRYQQEEAAFLQREKMAVSRDPNANPIRKDFIIKGIRAPKPDAHISYMRQQDKIMASIYGFEHDDRDAKVGQQDPVGQRRGLGKGRLRDRPKQTAKAAEADDGTVILGKRARKPNNLFAEAEPVSRGSTPVPVPQRRQRGRRAEENGDDHLLAPASQTEPAFEDTPKKRGRGGRPRKHPLPTPIPEYAPAHEVERESANEGQSSRKRTRRHREENKTKFTNRTSPGPPTESRLRRYSNMAEIPTSSFYSNHTMDSTQTNDESRPNTASSTQTTASTTVSTYGLREKRQRRFIDGEDDDDEDYDIEEQPKPKRVRRATKKVQEQDYTDAPDSHAHTEPGAAPAVKVPRIKIKNFTPGTTTSASVPGSNGSHSLAPATGPTSALASNGNAGNGATAGALADTNKEYGQMTKSEKMSYSMRARWANGSMGIAVEKRRATLYAKKLALEAARKADQGSKPPRPSDKEAE